MLEGTAWRLEPGSDLVVELHMMPTGKPEPIQISVGLFFTDDPPVRVPYMLRLGRQSIDIPAGASELHDHRRVCAAGGRGRLERPAPCP